MIRLRFVTCNDPISDAIRLRENFWASHVEAVTPDGKYLGAHADGGVQSRDPGYDKSTMMKELFVDLSSDDTMTNNFYSSLNSHIGEPYDFGAILGFVIPNINLHEIGHAICSALQCYRLRTCGWFKTPLVEEAHKVTPRDLLLVLSGIVEVKNP